MNLEIDEVLLAGAAAFTAYHVAKQNSILALAGAGVTAYFLLR